MPPVETEIRCGLHLSNFVFVWTGSWFVSVAFWTRSMTLVQVGLLAVTFHLAHRRDFSCHLSRAIHTHSAKPATSNSVAAACAPKVLDSSGLSELYRGCFVSIPLNNSNRTLEMAVVVWSRDIAASSMSFTWSDPVLHYGLESSTFSFQLLSLDVVCVVSCSIITFHAVAVIDIILPQWRGWDLVKSRLLISAREFAR